MDVLPTCPGASGCPHSAEHTCTTRGHGCQPWKHWPFPHQDRQKKKSRAGISLAVQWLGLCASTAGGVGSIPGQGTKIPHAAERGQKKAVQVPGGTQKAFGSPFSFSTKCEVILSQSH